MARKFAAVADQIGHPALEVSARHIARWEGKAPPTPRPKQAETLEALFGCSIAELGLGEPDVSYSEPDVWTIDTTRDALREAAEMSGRVDRRSVLVRSGTALGAYLLRWVINEPQFENWKAVAKGRPLSEEIVDNLQAQVDGLRMMDAEVGGASLEALARSTLSFALDLVDERNYNAPVGRRLFAVTADASTLAGWFAFDAGHYTSADRYLGAAVQAAHAAEDPELAAYAMSFMAIRSYATKHGRDGVTLMEAARAGIRSSAVPHLTAMLHLTEARSHAVAGNESAAYRSIERAQEEFERGPSDQEPHWLYWISPGEMFGQAGSAALDLGDYTRADRSFAEAADQYGDHANRSKTLHLVRRSIALAKAGESDEAATLTTETLSTAVPVRSKRFNEHLDELKRALPAGSRDGALQHAHDEIAEAMKASAKR
jgi:tetratricopeptide (TPR) repeat protein